MTSQQLKQTSCPYCGVGCGIDVQVTCSDKSAATSTDKSANAELSGLTGSPEHPANFGRLCVKGSNLLETNTTQGRLLKPQVKGQETDWHTATQAVANGFTQIIDKYGADSVAFYVSGQLLTEDYYVANKLMKGYIGSANIDTNSRLCMSSAVAAYKRAFGADAVPCCYEDLEQTELLVLIGSNAAWTHPVLFQRMQRAKQLNPEMRIVVIDPRRTASCELADLHLAIKPGSDVAIFNGLLRYLASQGTLDDVFVAEHTQGYERALAVADCWSESLVAEYCDLDIDDLSHFYRLFAESKRAISFYSMGVNQSVQGVDKANSIINCHLASGKIGKLGCGPFSITGQPNAMGGREVGGLANMLAAHMDIDNPDHRILVQKFWRSPHIADRSGLKAVELFDKIESGEVKAVWIMATNPLVSMPNRNQIERALQKCELVVVSDYVASNDTLAFADVKLPATGWSEKNGTVTNSERRISRQRGLLPPSGEAKHDWQIICDVAKAMGFSGFEFENPAQIFDEHARLTAYQNKGCRDLDLSGLVGMSEREYDQLCPIQWPVNQQFPAGKARLFEDGQFYTSNGRANFIAVNPVQPQQQTCGDYPFVLNSGRMRDHWHTLTRTGSASQLTQHAEQSFVAMHALDANALDVREKDLVMLQSKQSQQQVILPVTIDNGQRRGELFAPIHWNKQFSSHAAIGYLFDAAYDPLSGQPELKHAAVAVAKVEVFSRGILVSREALNTQACSEMFDYWQKTPVEGGFIYHFAEFASDSPANSLNVHSVTKQLNQLFDEDHASLKWHSQTSEKHQHVFALQDEKLVVAVFMQENPPELARGWLASLLSAQAIQAGQVHALLNGEVEASFQQGKIVCSCFQVGEKAIVEAIQQGCDSVDALAHRLKCGTNCGSCRPELSQLISHTLGSESVPNDDSMIAIKQIDLVSADDLPNHQNALMTDVESTDTAEEVL